MFHFKPAILTLIAATFLVSSTVLAQTPTPTKPKPKEDDEIIKVSSRLVVVPV